MDTESIETVVERDDNDDIEGVRCPGCSFYTSTRFRLESEPDRQALCGSCFSAWLHRRNAGIHLRESSPHSTEEATS